ncbi:hypothetical protein BOX15_Mlig034529g6, partial [Macrostomum lignano]
QPPTAAMSNEFSREEIRSHTSPDSRWLVVDNAVYDVSRWAQKHPGGSRLLSHYAGQDATEAFRAFHLDQSTVAKWLAPLRIGRVCSNDPERLVAMRTDFERLRKDAQARGLFKPSLVFYALMLAHIFALEAIAYACLRFWGTGWLPYIVALCLYATAQSQASWLQHDFGHLSVFHNRRWDGWLHQLTMSYFKGASAHWWKHLHYQHHSKPNVMNKDPDVRIQPLFVVGKTMPKETAANPKSPYVPYHFQHRYFFAIGPPLLFPVYFQIATFRHALSRRCYVDLACMALFFAKIVVLYRPLLGLGGAFLYYFLVRMIESHWFTWVSQSNHIPMEIEHDRAEPWLALQLHATCDIEKSPFNDWFTGHLNFQIEHHLFPTMPRHNYYKIQPDVQHLCQKYGIRHEIKPLWRAFCDVIGSLRHSGEIWHAAYHAHHMD